MDRRCKQAQIVRLPSKLMGIVSESSRPIHFVSSPLCGKIEGTLDGGPSMQFLSVVIAILCYLGSPMLKAQGLQQSKPWLGIAIEQGKDGVRIKAILPDTPAEKAGLKAEDEVLKVDGKAVKDPAELIQLIQSKGVGFKVTLDLLRNSKSLSTSIQLVAQPDALAMLRKLYVDKPAPTLAVERVSDGKRVRIEDLKGKVVLLEFWTTWCPACRASIPHLNSLSKKHPDLQILAVSDEDPATLRSFLSKTEIEYPIYSDPKGEANQAFQVSSIPSFFLIDRQGVVRDLALGAGVYLEDLSRTLEAVLKQPGRK